MRTLKKIFSISGILFLIVFLSFTMPQKNANFLFTQIKNVPTPDEVNSLFDGAMKKSDDYIKDVNTRILVWSTSINKINTLFNLDNDKNIKISYVVVYKKNNSPIGLSVQYFSPSDKSYYNGVFKLSSDKSTYTHIGTYTSNTFLTTDILLMSKVWFSKADANLFYDPQHKNLFKTNTDISDIQLVMKIKKLNYNPKELAFYNYYNKIKPDDPCGHVANCLKGGGATCNPIAGWVCTKGACPAEQLKNRKPENITSLIKYYQLRDNVLSRYLLGKHYINLYYGSSTHIIEALNAKIIAKLIKAFPEIDKSVNRLLDKNYKGAIIESSLKSQLDELIDLFYNNTSSQEFKKVLRQVKKDLNNFSNKNKEDFLKMLKA